MKIFKFLSFAGLCGLISLNSGCDGTDSLNFSKMRKNPSFVGESEFQALLKRGRRGLGVDRKLGFSLAKPGSDVISFEDDVITGYPSKLLFNTDLVESIAESNLVDDCRGQGSKRSFGFDASELVATDKSKRRVSDGLVVVSLERSYLGVQVNNALFQCSYFKKSEGFHLAQILNQTFGKITGISMLETAVTEETLRFKTGIDTVEVTQATPTIYVKKAEDGGSYDFTLADRFSFKDTESGYGYSVTVSRNAEMLEAAADIFQVDHKLQVVTHERSPFFNKTVEVPLAGVSVGGSVTDKNGNFDLVGNIVEFSVLAPEASALVDGQAAPHIISTNAGANGVTTFSPANIDDEATVNVLKGVQDVHALASKYLSLAEAPFLGNPVTVRTNIADVCNAFFNPQDFSINFFTSGPAGNGQNCENTALIADVVYHEWGHALDFALGGIPDGAFSEGIGDILSALITRSPNMAPGFFIGSEAGIRNLKANSISFPPSAEQQQLVHVEGQIIGGAFWGIIESFMLLKGDKGVDEAAELFFKHLISTQTYRNSYDALLLLDNSTGNPASKSPNYCTINRSFAAKGLTTLDACVDETDEVKVLVENYSPDSSRDSTNATVSISGFEGVDIFTCPGDVEECDEDSKGYVKFNSAPGSNVEPAEGRVVYTEKMALTDKGFTVFVAAGATTLGRKVVEFKK